MSIRPRSFRTTIQDVPWRAMDEQTVYHLKGDENLYLCQAPGEFGGEVIGSRRILIEPLRRIAQSISAFSLEPRTGCRAILDGVVEADVGASSPPRGRAPLQDSHWRGRRVA
jgi:hypothetical protein